MTLKMRTTRMVLRNLNLPTLMGVEKARLSTTNSSSLSSNPLTSGPTRRGSPLEQTSSGLTGQSYKMNSCYTAWMRLKRMFSNLE